MLGSEDELPLVEEASGRGEGFSEEADVEEAGVEEAGAEEAVLSKTRRMESGEFRIIPSTSEHVLLSTSREFI